MHCRSMRAACWPPDAGPQRQDAATRGGPRHDRARGGSNRLTDQPADSGQRPSGDRLVTLQAPPPHLRLPANIGGICLGGRQKESKSSPTIRISVGENVCSGDSWRQITFQGDGKSRFEILTNTPLDCLPNETRIAGSARLMTA